MSDDVKLTYKRVGLFYEGTVDHKDGTETFSGSTFAGMMGLSSQMLRQNPEAELVVLRNDRPGLLAVTLEPKLRDLLRDDPAAYIEANTIPDRVIDLRKDRTSALVTGEKYDMPRTGGLRHGLGTLADAFGEVLYAKARKAAPSWLYEHPATGRWSDLRTVEHWLGSHDTEVQAVDEKGGWLLIKVDYLLKTGAERFYYPREWNEFGSWITKDQLRTKLEQFRKDRDHVARK